jgi:hypothetical protein
MKLKLFFLLLTTLLSSKLFAASTPPVGFVDQLDKNKVYGWAKDPDNPNSPISVHVYCYPRGSSNAIWGISIKADKYRSDVGAHGFTLTDRRYTQLPDGEYEIVAYAIGRDKSGKNDNQNVPLKLTHVGKEVSPTRQLIKKDTFAHGKYMVFSQYLGIMWDEQANYDMYQSAIRVGDSGKVYNFYTRQSKEASGETVYLRTSPNGITNWSDFTKVLDLGRYDDLDSKLIADGNVVAVPEGDHYRFWMHYTGRPSTNPNHVFQATTTSKSPYHFIKRTETGNTLTALPMFSPSHNNQSNTYGAGQPSFFKGGDGLWHMYFTETTVRTPARPYVVHKAAKGVMALWQENDPTTYDRDVMPSPITALNSSEFTYYPRLETYAAVNLYSRPKIFVGSTPTDFDSESGSLIYDSQNDTRSYITEGGLLRNVNGQITTSNNSTIAYYGAGEYSPDRTRYWTTGTGATRFYLYKL